MDKGFVYEKHPFEDAHELRVHVCVCNLALLLRVVVEMNLLILNSIGHSSIGKL